MSYTTDELNAAIEKIVRTSLRREYGELGNRRLDYTFSDIQDAAAGVFILFPNAPFYVVMLAARRLQKAIETEQELLAAFVDTVEATGRDVRDITSLSPLKNAASALANLAAAAGSRTTDFDDIESVPAFKRFEQTTQRFLDESSSNVVQDGEIVQTPREARSLLAGLYRALRTQHQGILRRVGLLAGAVDDFNSLSLAKTLSENIINNSRSLIDEIADELDGMTEDERMEIIRLRTLDILAARMAVRSFGSISGPTTFLSLTGDGRAFADAYHPATPAYVQSDILDPYPILTDARDIDLLLDGDSSPTTTIQVLGSFIPRIESTLTDESTFDLGTPSSNGSWNGELRIALVNYPSVGSSTNIDVLFDASSNTAAAVAETINARVTAIGGSPRIPLTAEPYANPLKFSGPVDMTNAADPKLDMTSINPATDFTALGLEEGDKIYVDDPTSTNFGAVYTIDIGGLSALTLNCTRESGVAASNESAMNTEVGDAGLALRLRISDNIDVQRFVQPTPVYHDYRAQALDDRVGLGIPTEGFNTYLAHVIGSIDLNTLALPGDVAGDTMVVSVDAGIDQVVDLTGFVGATVPAFIIELQAQTTGIAIGVQSGTGYLTLTSNTPGPSSRMEVKSGTLLDDLFTGGAAGAPYKDGGLSTTDSQFNAATNLGLFPGMQANAKLSPAPDIVAAYNSSPQAAVSGVVRTQAQAVFVAQYYEGRGRTEPSDILRLVASKFQGVGDVAGSGTTAIFTVSGASTAGVALGDLVAVRSHSDSSLINEYGTITSVDDAQIVATMAVTITPESGIDVECGPDLSAIGFDATAVVSGGSFNDGIYGITGLGTVPFELDVSVQLPINAAAGYLPVVFTLAVGRYAVHFKTMDTTLATSVEVDAVSSASAASKFFSSLPASDVGESKYFQLPEWPRGIEEQDVLERHVTSVRSPDTTHQIVALEASSLLVQVTPELSTDTGTITLSQNQPIPFARIRKKRLDTYETLKGELYDWLELDENQDRFFTNFNRLLNPLNSSNPTPVEVNDAKSGLLSLAVVLVSLNTALDAYTADEVIQVDALLHGFRQKGADRAVDVLLEAQFSTFFGLSQDELSYAGTVQKQMRDIQRQDLPVRRDRLRRGYRDDGILAQLDDVNYEYNTSDIDNEPEPDFPIGEDIPWPERAY